LTTSAFGHFDRPTVRNVTRDCYVLTTEKVLYMVSFAAKARTCYNACDSL